MAKVTPLKKQVTQPETESVVITPPRLRYGTVMIRGTAPYIQNRFSSENREKMVAQQQAGSSSKKTKRAKPAKDFEKVFRGSAHVSQEGWYGIPATALRNAMIDACRLTEIDMIRAKMCVFIIPDGLDKENLEPLVRINGEPMMHLDRVKVGINSTDIAARAMFTEWSAKVRLRWDAGFFSASDVLNLLARAGWQVGIGAGRPLSKMSAGTGKGTFEVEGMEDVRDEENKK